MDPPVYLTKELVVGWSHVHGLVRVRHWDHHAGVVQDIHEAGEPDIVEASRGDGGAGCYSTDETVDGSSCARELCGAVPVLHVELLVFSFLDVQRSNFERILLLILPADKERPLGHLSGQPKVYACILPTVRREGFALLQVSICLVEELYEILSGVLQYLPQFCEMVASTP